MKQSREESTEFQDFNHTQGGVEYISASVVKQSLVDVNGAKRAVVHKDRPEDKVFLFQEVLQVLNIQTP